MAKKKLKTHKGTAKRIKKTGKGKIKIKGVGVHHILSKKSRKRKNKGHKFHVLNLAESKVVNRLLPYQ